VNDGINKVVIAEEAGVWTDEEVGGVHDGTTEAGYVIGEAAEVKKGTAVRELLTSLKRALVVEAERSGVDSTDRFTVHGLRDALIQRLNRRRRKKCALRTKSFSLHG
jgi:hypothetical protein